MSQCGKDARGDQSDACGAVPEPESLLEPVCASCGKPVSFRKARHLYIAVSRLERQLQALVDAHPDWRRNAIAFTNNYIRDRALTRDLERGIPVLRAGYESKTIYIWAENVRGISPPAKPPPRKEARIFPGGNSSTATTESCWEGMEIL